MFAIIQLKDIIQIHPASTSKKKAVLDGLNKKYANKAVPDIGIAIVVSEIENITSYEIIDGYLRASVAFKILVYRFFIGEIIEAKIYEQEEDYIRLQLPFFDDIVVKKDGLMSNCRRTYVLPEGGTRKCMMWCWSYDNDLFYFRNGETVRFKVKKVVYKPLKIEGCMDETGLGPLTWWI